MMVMADVFKPISRGTSCCARSRMLCYDLAHSNMECWAFSHSKVHARERVEVHAWFEKKNLPSYPPLLIVKPEVYGYHVEYGALGFSGPSAMQNGSRDIGDIICINPRQMR